MSVIVVTMLIVACGDQDAPLGPDDGGPLAPLYMATTGQGISGRYIVVMRPGAATGLTAATTAAGLGVIPRHVYRGPQAGFAADLTDSQVETLRRDLAVAWIEQDQVFSIGKTQIVDGGGDPWGLDRIDQADLPLSGSYTYRKRGTGVTVYVIDTGILATHRQFKKSGVSRVNLAFDAFGGSGTDCNGHGTHVAGTIGGKTYGVAKLVMIESVRVLDCDGSGSLSTVVAGLDYVFNNPAGTPEVANMSLGGPPSKTMNLWVDALSAFGVFVVVSAGNDDENACSYSPANALGAFTVAASDKTDGAASFTNWGRCVDIYAPGVSILSAWFTRAAATAFLSGTSMASPHVAGVAVQLKEKFGNLSWTSMVKKLRARAVASRIVNNDGGSIRYGTPNLLVQMTGL